MCRIPHEKCVWVFNAVFLRAVDRFYFGTFGSDGEDSANIFAFATSRAVRRSECGLPRSFFQAGVDADYAGMFAIGNAKGVLFLHQRHTVHDVERSRVDVQQAAIWVELHDPLVAVAVGNEEDARRRHSHVCRLAKVFLVRSRDESFAQRQTWHPTSFGELMGEMGNGNVSKQIRLQPKVAVNHQGKLQNVNIAVIIP